MSSFDSSASEHETRVLNQSFCVDFFHISALKVDSKGRLYISVKCYDSDLRWLIFYLFFFFLRFIIGLLAKRDSLSTQT